MKKELLILIIFLMINIVYADTPISSCLGLQNMQNDLNGNYYLTGDIDCTDSKNWNSGTGFVTIGANGFYGSDYFNGELDGRNFRIINLTIFKPSRSYNGLFSTLSDIGKVKNLKLTGVNITIKTMSGVVYVGGIVGLNLGIIENVSVEGNINGTTSSYSGLIAGESFGIINRSYSQGYCSGDDVGGLTGGNSGDIIDSYSLANVHCVGNAGWPSNVGGLAGGLYSSGKIERSFSNGTVTSRYYVLNLGGLVGKNEAGICIDNYWDIQTSGLTTSACGNGKTTLEMKQQSTFTNWDFNNLWKINEGTSYPYFNLASSTPPVISGCVDSQRIMRINRDSNAHGEVYNAGNYGIEICYDQIFGSTYSGTNPHTCSGSNTIVWLNKTSNSHASLTQSVNYNTQICYGDLSCIVRQNACQGTEKLVIALNKTTNSHLSNTNTNYKNLICCTSGIIIPPEAITNAIWRDVNSNAISQAKRGDIVQLYVTATGMNGRILQLKIYNGTLLWRTETATIQAGTAMTTISVGDFVEGDVLKFEASEGINSRVSNNLLIIEDSPSVSTCNDYTTEATCLAYEGIVANFTVELIQGQGFCGLTGCLRNTCRCQWHSGVCEGGYSTENICTGGSGECTWQSSTMKNCDVEPLVGFRVLNISKIWAGDPSLMGSCIGEEIIQRKCISSTLLDFYSIISFLISIIIIVSIYLIKWEN